MSKNNFKEQLKDLNALKSIIERQVKSLDKVHKENEEDVNKIMPNLLSDLQEHIKNNDFKAIKEKMIEVNEQANKK